MKSTKHAFTLIELLIVVAMIAIFSGGTIAVITGPLMEERRATESLAAMSGRANLITCLTSDFHSAETIDFDESTKVLTIDFQGPNHSVIYFIDEKQFLRRAIVTGDTPVTEDVRRNSASLLGPVKEFSATRSTGPDSPLWRIHIGCDIETLGQTAPSSVDLELAAEVSP